jgi:hypothetical protein
MLLVMHHTLPIDHWPPTPLPEPRQRRRRSSVALLTEFRTKSRTWSTVGRGPTVSDALYDAWTSIPTPGEWRLARFFPAESSAVA